MFVKPLIAIDIGSASVKVVELTKGEPKKLKNVGLEVIPKGVVVDDEIRDQDTLVAVIEGLFRKMKISKKGRRVAISIGGSNLLIKKAIFTVDKNSETDEQIYEEAKQQFHNDLEDMYFRYQEIPSAFTRDEEKAYLIVACRIEIVEQYVQLIHALNMKIGIIDSEVLSLFNIFNYNFDNDTGLTALVNIGASKTNILLSINGEYLYSREITFGGQEFTTKIASDLNLELENAEALKISGSLGDEAVADQIRASITYESEVLIGYIQDTVNFFLYKVANYNPILTLSRVFI